MTIKIGKKIPSVLLRQLENGRLKELDTLHLFEGKKVVLFAVIGAFTPSCTVEHLPGYARRFDEFKKLGIDVVCTSVNDPFVMHEWSKAQKTEGITMLADGNGTFARELGLEMDAGGFGMGKRSQRYALYAEDGIVKVLAVEKPGVFEVSSAEAMLKAIKALP